MTSKPNTPADGVAVCGFKHLATVKLLEIA